MEAEAFQSEEILFDLAANEFCVLQQFYGTITFAAVIRNGSRQS
jgi:hypothetical protein